MKKILLKLTCMAALLSAGYGQCNEENYEEYLPNLQGCDLINCPLQHINFAGVDLSGANLSGADLFSANFYNANLSGANLSGANLHDVDLDDTNLVGANLDLAILLNTKVSDANLTEATLKNTQIYSADFTNSNLSYANLFSAWLGEANFTGASFLQATFFNANFSAAILDYANLEGACLEGARGFPTHVTPYVGTPIFEGCACEGEGCFCEEGECAFEDTDEDGHDDASFAAGAASVDANNDGLVDAFPTLSIINGNATVLIQGTLDEYTDSGASCSDQEDGDITQSVEVSGQVVNMNIPGTYTISYNCSDSDGNAAQTKDRTVFVIPPIIADENGDGFDDDGFMAGAQSGDVNLDGFLNVVDIVSFVSMILSSE